MSFDNVLNSFGKFPYLEMVLLQQNQLPNRPNKELLTNVIYFEPDNYLKNQKPAYNGDNSVQSIDDIFPDKVESAKSLVTEITGELEEREKLKKANLTRIEYDIIKAQNYLKELEGFRGYLSPNLVGRRRTSLDLQIFNLYREKRDQYVNAFRDTVFLKKDLLAALREYWAAQRETELLGDEGYSPLEASAGMF